MRLIQITDCHLGVDTQHTLLGVNTDQSLRDVLQLVQDENPEFAAILCSGDIANDCHAPCYPRFVNTLREYFSQPLGWIAGNHDDAILMNGEFLGLAEHRVMQVGEWQIILLDSSVPEHVHGELAATELDFLRAALAASHRPTMVALHHQLMPVGSEWIDKYIVRNAETVLTILSEYPQVKVVTFGHVHQDFSSNHKGIACFATPSTCIQFKPGSKDFAIDATMPGYRWFDLAADGSFTTGVSRIAEKDYPLDMTAEGY